MQRITEKQLAAIVERINKVTNSPLEPYTKQPDGKYAANIGNYHLSFAYGGVCLERMVSQSGGVTNVLGCGHTTKRDLAEKMWAFLNGFDAAKQSTALPVS